MIGKICKTAYCAFLGFERDFISTYFKDATIHEIYVQLFQYNQFNYYFNIPTEVSITKGWSCLLIGNSYFWSCLLLLNYIQS